MTVQALAIRRMTKATDTYTWVVEGYQGEQYTVKEQNYTAKDITSEETSRAGALKKAFTSTSRYSIHNAENHEHDTNDDKLYPEEGVSVTMDAYATDIDEQYYQTVHLTNIYAQAGILTLSKADRIIGHGLGNVQFKLSNQNGSELELLRRPNTNQYSVKTQQAGNLGYTETVPDNIVQTDANGYVQLRLPPLIDGDTLDVSYEGKYFLEEILPEGYTGAKKISITVTDQGEVRFTLAAWKDNSGKMHYSNHALLVIRNAPVSADISFEKVDAEHGRALANAEFTLYSDEQCTKMVTGEGFKNPEISYPDFGTIQFTKLPAGTYYFKETKAPPGYEMDDTIYKAVIRNGKTDITPMPKGREEESKQSNGVTVTNVSKMKLTIKKVDMDGNLITSSPATFKIQDGTDSTKIQQTNNGEITLTNVTEGEQYIFEVSAPEGYKTLDTHVTLEIANGEIKSIEDNPDKEHWVLQRDGDCSYTLTVKNEPLVSLPSAGGRGYPLALLLGAGLMCGASGLALWLRRRRNQ